MVEGKGDSVPLLDITAALAGGVVKRSSRSGENSRHNERERCHDVIAAIVGRVADLPSDRPSSKVDEQHHH